MIDDLADLLVLGDSHTRYMLHGIRHKLYRPRKVEVCRVHGATAAGLRNPNSITNALGAFQAFLAGRSRDSVIAIHLGEVDCGILAWVRAEKHGMTVSEALEQSVAAEMSFVDEVRRQGFRSLIVTGATLPTINDADRLGAVVNERRSKVHATQAERTELSRQFNGRLEEEARKRDLLYTDVDDIVLDQETGLVDIRYRNKDPADHHMDNLLASVPWAMRLNDAMDRLRPLATREEQWHAVSETFLKMHVASAEQLPDCWKIRIKPGDRLQARLRDVPGGTLVFSDAQLNGRPLPPGIRFGHAPHWRSKPVRLS